jgi:hypothetical protein
MPAIKIARNLFFLLCGIAAVSFTVKQPSHELIEKNTILIFSKTNGYRHESIETQ